MKKPKLVTGLSQNANDCWNIALSLALDKSYEEIRDMLKPFIQNDGGMLGYFTRGILQNEGYHHFVFSSNDQLNVESCINYFDSKNNHLLVGTDEHVFYVHNNTIYDGSFELKDLLPLLVEDVWVKIK